ncbi:MAG: DMT family transporter [Gudongella sp.]|nr:DMT family transporter [Gudongella sp.]
MGVFYILTSSVFFVLSAYFGKLVANTTEMNAIITSFTRYSLGSVVMIIYMLTTKKSFIPNRLAPITKRAIFNSGALILSTLALNYTTLTNANILHLTYPVFVVVLAPFITKEKSRKSVYFYLIMILIGSYIISAPDLTHINFGDVLAFVSAIFAGISILYLTEARKTESGSLIVLYLMVIGTIINGPMILKDLGLIDMDSIGIVLLAAAFGFFGQVLTTEGYRYVSSAKGAMLSTSRIIFATFLGYFLLSEPLNFRIILGIVITTIALVGVSGYFNFARKSLQVDLHKNWNNK